MDHEDGNIVQEEKDWDGFKVPIEIHRPDMCLVLDECECNISWENDKRVGNEMFLAGVHNMDYCVCKYS